MRRFRFPRWIVSSASCCVLLIADLLPIQAQESPSSATQQSLTPAVSLRDAQRFALANNWDVLTAQTTVDAAMAQKIVSEQWPNPNLTLSTTKIDVDGHSSRTSEGNNFWQRSYDTTVALNQLFEIGKRGYRQDSAQAGLVATKARLADARRLLELLVATTYINALQAEANVEVLSQSAQMLREEAAIAGSRLSAGDISVSDKDQIEIIADRFELDAQNAQVAAVSARIELELALGIKAPQGNTQLTDTLDVLSKQSQDPPAGGEPRPDLMSAQAEVSRAQAEVRLQVAQRIPDPTLLVQYEHEPADKPNTIGIGLSFPLPLFNYNTGGIALAKSTHAQATTVLARTRAQISAQETIAHAAYENARARMIRYHDVIRPRSEQLRKTIAYAYSKGGASLLDLLIAERSDNEVRLAAVQAAADAAAAAAALRAALNIVETAP